MDIKGTVYALPTPTRDTEKYTKSIQVVYLMYTESSYRYRFRFRYRFSFRF